MALVLKDRVKETSSTAGTGTLTLSGAVPGFQSFSVIGDANTTYYTVSDSINGDWEVGIGTYTSSGTTLSRDTVLASSNANALVNFAANPKDVFVVYPADKAVYLDSTSNVTLPGELQVTGDTALSANLELASTTAITKNAVGAYIFADIKYFTSGTGATYTPTTGTRAIYVEVVGGGGGGGGCTGVASGVGIGGCGGGGGYAAELITDMNQTFTYTVGAGGTAGPASATAGGTGGTTSFVGSVTGTISATGGAGGAGSTAATGTGAPRSSAGGVGSGGDLNRYGSNSLGGYGSGTTLFMATQAGQSGFFSAGLGPGNSTANSAGAAGRSVGEGGTGGYSNNSTTARGGGVGGAGIIRVTEYF